VKQSSTGWKLSGSLKNCAGRQGSLAGNIILPNTGVNLIVMIWWGKAVQLKI